MTYLKTTPLLSDHWTKDDQLGLEVFRSILCAALTAGPTRITVGIFGDWGSGKTSLMRMLMDDVAAAGHRAVWFDAWKYDRASLSRALIQRVIDELRQEVKANKEASATLEDLELHLYQDTDREQEGELTLDWRGALKGTLKLGLSMLPVVGGGLAEIAKQFDAKGAGGVEDVIRSLKRERVELHRERYQHLDEFQEAFARVLAPLTAAGKRLAIFIDDLDRCLPEDAIQVLETIKLYLEAEGCVFVVGADCQVIEKGIRMRYRDYLAAGDPCPISGADYLEKLVQVPFHLPPIEQEKLKSYITSLYPDCPGSVPDVCTAGLEPNPRKVKRAINVFLIVWTVANIREDLRGVIDSELLMKLVILQLRWPDDLFLRVRREPQTLVLLEERLDQYESPRGPTRARPPAPEQPPALEGEGKADRLHGEPQAPAEPQSDEYARYVMENEALRRLLSAGQKRFKQLSAAHLRKHVFLASTTAVQAAEMSPDLWQRLLSDDEAMRRGAAAELGERPEPERQAYRTRSEEAMRAADLPAKTRCRAGAALAQLRDPRPGVSLAATGLPDISWCDIPAGPFTMGSKPEDEGSDDDERPQHQCDIPYDYRISRHPITVAQYQAFVKADGTAPHEYGLPFSLPNHPVVGVSWYEAMAFTRWLTAQRQDRDGWVVDLPSEAEWEKAARGSADARRYPWGDTLEPERANYAATGIGSTSAVGCFPGGVSPYGVEECSGNVWEWTRSRLAGYPYVAGDGRENPEGDETRVVRGGAWDFTYPRFLRVAFRYWYVPSDWFDFRGFRCVLRPPGL